MPSARSAAAVPRRQVRTPAPEPRGVTLHAPRIRVRWDRAGRIALLVVLAVVVGLYVQHTLAYLAIRSQASSQQAIVDRLQVKNAALAREQRSLSEAATIVQDARRLGMVRPGERPYAITGQSAH